MDSEDTLAAIAEPNRGGTLGSLDYQNAVVKVQGSGLGLAIVKDILNKYKWHIVVKSEVGKGTKIQLTNIKLY